MDDSCWINGNQLLRNIEFHFQFNQAFFLLTKLHFILGRPQVSKEQLDKQLDDYMAKGSA